MVHVADRVEEPRRLILTDQLRVRFDRKVETVASRYDTPVVRRPVATPPAPDRTDLKDRISALIGDI